MMPVEKRDSERAYDSLVEMLLSGTISEDQALSERRLAEMLSLGRTPIREAIKDLVREGVLESHPTRGTILRPLSLTDLQDLYEIRFAIEGLAAFLAAERGQIEELRPYTEAFEQTLRDPDSCDITKVHDHGVDFHFEIMRLAGNRRLLEMYRPFRLRFRIPFGIVRTSNPERVLAAVAEHLDLANAIAGRKADLARTLMCEHLRKGLDYRTGMLLKRSRYAMPPAGGGEERTEADASESTVKPRTITRGRGVIMKHVFAVAALAGLTAISLAAEANAETTLEAVKARDKVICGANGGRPGFSGLDSKGLWQGIDTDVCRAIAAATVGDASKTQFVKVTSQTRFTALQTSEVDVLTANVTWTLSRDSSLGLDFVAPIFYDGQGLMVRKDLGVKSSKDLDGATVCVEPGSTSEKVVADIFRANGISYKPVVIEDRKELNNAFFNGRCDVHVQSTSGLSSGRATAASNPDDFVILPEVYGKDPMGPVVRQGDAQWRDIVAWTVYAMMAAEEFGITSKNIDEKKTSDDADIARLLGTSGELGKTLGLDNEWAYRIIKQVGNYGEVFERTLGKGSPLKLERGINGQWKDGGLIYAPPFN